MNYLNIIYPLKVDLNEAVDGFGHICIIVINSIDKKDGSESFRRVNPRNVSLELSRKYNFDYHRLLKVLVEAPVTIINTSSYGSFKDKVNINCRIIQLSEGSLLCSDSEVSDCKIELAKVEWMMKFKGNFKFVNLRCSSEFTQPSTFFLPATPPKEEQVNSPSCFIPFNQCFTFYCPLSRIKVKNYLLIIDDVIKLTYIGTVFDKVLGRIKIFCFGNHKNIGIKIKIFWGELITICKKDGSNSMPLNKLV